MLGERCRTFPVHKGCVMKLLQKVKAMLMVGLLLLTGLMGSVAHAAGTVDLTTITGAVSAGDITVGVLAIGAVMAVVYMTIKAAKIVIGVLKAS